jgi:hypothetical protein
MKYSKWNDYTDYQKQLAITRELELDSHNGTTKADLLNMIHFVERQQIENRGKPFPCGWCGQGLRFECYLIDDDGNTASIDENIVQTVIAKYCPECGRELGAQSSPDATQQEEKE